MSDPRLIATVPVKSPLSTYILMKRKLNQRFSGWSRYVPTRSGGTQSRRQKAIRRPETRSRPRCVTRSSKQRRKEKDRAPLHSEERQATWDRPTTSYHWRALDLTDTDIPDHAALEQHDHFQCLRLPVWEAFGSCKSCVCSNTTTMSVLLPTFFVAVKRPPTTESEQTDEREQV